MIKPDQNPGVVFKGGIPVSIRNSTWKGDGFHISYNSHDIALYGCDTTAIVVKNWNFYILNGDHTEQLIPLIGEGLDACLKYFNQHPDQHNSMTVHD